MSSIPGSPAIARSARRRLAALSPTLPPSASTIRARPSSLGAAVAVRGGAQRLEDVERGAVFGHVVHAQHRSAAHERNRVGGERAGETPVDLGADDPADERLARKPDEDRRAEAAEAIEVPDAGMVLLRRLAEADAGIEQNAAERHAGARGEIERALEEALDVVENVDRRIRRTRDCA